MYKLSSALIVVFTFMITSGCSFGPQNHVHEIRTKAGSNPENFYTFAESIGKNTTAFNPCKKDIAESSSSFSASSKMRDRTESGIEAELRANVSKVGKCL
jgi:hypothetical protein